jgi:DNA-binding NarL/FixJ family response regulator
MSHAVGAKMKATDRSVRILIADDQPIIRTMVRSTLERIPHFEVCAEAVNGAEAIEQAQKLKPDVVVLNVTMPVLNGFDAAREIKATLPETAIVILSSHSDQRFVAAAKRIGVRSYVAKSKVGEALVKAIEAAVKGDDFVLVE